MKAGMTIISLAAPLKRASPIGQESSHLDNSFPVDSTRQEGRNNGGYLSLGALPHERMMRFPEAIIKVFFQLLLSPVFAVLACFERYLHPNRCGEAPRPRRNHEQGQ
jgi:hypothetical protein